MWSLNVIGYVSDLFKKKKPNWNLQVCIFQTVKVNLYTIVFIISFYFFLYSECDIGIIGANCDAFCRFPNCFYAFVKRSYAIQHTDVKVTVCNSKFMLHLLKWVQIINNSLKQRHEPHTFFFWNFNVKKLLSKL